MAAICHMSTARDPVLRLGTLVDRNSMTATSTTAHIGGINKRGQPRRKVILACERCREKKIRCDGANPICSHCRRPGYGIDRCIHRTDSARTAISDEYLKTLHRRIRQLEEACSKAGIAVPPVSTQCESKDPVVSEINPAITVKTVPLSLDGAAQTVNESRYGTSPTTSTSGSSSLQGFNSP